MFALILLYQYQMSLLTEFGISSVRQMFDIMVRSGLSERMYWDDGIDLFSLEPIYVSKNKLLFDFIEWIVVSVLPKTTPQWLQTISPSSSVTLSFIWWIQNIGLRVCINHKHYFSLIMIVENYSKTYTNFRIRLTNYLCCFTWFFNITVFTVFRTILFPSLFSIVVFCSKV